MLLPTEFITGSSATPLLKSWDSVCEIAHYGYGEMRNNKGATRRLAGELTAAAASPRARTEALHRFVRDEIQHDGALGVFALGDDETIDRVVKDRRGGAAEKAVVLEEMLDAAGLAPRLVWAGDRQQGRIDPEIVNPVWFERVLVMVELDGAARTLSYRRRVELRRSEFQPGAQYAALRALTAAVEKADAQPLVLAAR
jgi:hypothetical protein